MGATQINPDCGTCGGTGVKVTTVQVQTFGTAGEYNAVRGTGACPECVTWRRLRTKGGADFIATRHALIDSVGVTLDGKPARISGAMRDEAHVWSDPESEGVPFSWETVRRVVMERGGAFRS